MYVEFVRKADVATFIRCHVNAFRQLGIPRRCLYDDAKVVVLGRTEAGQPMWNQRFLDFALRLGFDIQLCRPYRAQTKAKVEAGVLQSERWNLAALRNRMFLGLGEANEAISEALEEPNHKPFQKLGGCRASVFEDTDKPALKPLPATRYEYAEWKKARVNIDYHIEVDHNYYSVPHKLARQQVDVRLAARTVEVLYKGKRVASHGRCYGKGHFSTIMEHRPVSHQKHLEWTPSRIIGWAESSGPNTARMVKTIMRDRPHPEQGYRSCLGLFRLGKRYSLERLEAACGRALGLGACSYQSVRSILEKSLDLVPVEQRPAMPAIKHSNLRGQTTLSRKEVTDAYATDSREPAPHAPSRHGRRLPRSTRKPRGRRVVIRRALRPPGGLRAHLAREPAPFKAAKGSYPENNPIGAADPQGQY